MSITPSDFRNGLIFEQDGKLIQVVEFQHVKPGKGPAFVRCKFRNLMTGALYEDKVRPNMKLEEVRVEKRVYDYLYADGDMMVLMDKETYDQINVPADILGKQAELLLENEEIAVSMNGDIPISAEMPMNVVRTITFCEPGVKGDTATNATKAATVEGGATVQVPLFLNQGDKIRISTADFKYVERAKE